MFLWKYRITINNSALPNTSGCVVVMSDEALQQALLREVRNMARWRLDDAGWQERMHNALTRLAAARGYDQIMAAVDGIGITVEQITTNAPHGA